MAAASPQDVAFSTSVPMARPNLAPFSPFSDSNVAEMGVREALKSPPLFRKTRAAKALGWEHTGGCTLFEHRKEIEKMVV